MYESIEEVVRKLAIVAHRAMNAEGADEHLPSISGFDDETLEHRPFQYVPLMHGEDEFIRAYQALVELGFEALCDSAAQAFPGSLRDAESFLIGMISSAAQRIYFEGLPDDEATFATTVVGNVSQLRAAAVRRPIEVLDVYGITHLRLERHSSIETPWGTIVSVPRPHNSHHSGLRPAATALLVSTGLTTRLYGKPSPDEVRLTKAEDLNTDRMFSLVPLAFALEPQQGRRGAPTFSWVATISPFQIGMSPAFYLTPTLTRPLVMIPDSRTEAVSDRMRSMNTDLQDTLQVAARRAVSALVHRTNAGDALIDAVMAWESLVGGNTETTFRVTAALTLLLEIKLAERIPYYKKLKKIYETRSRIVHGEPQSIRSNVQADADQAIQVALEALSRLYELGGEWLTLSTSERAERLILAVR